MGLVVFARTTDQFAHLHHLGVDCRQHPFVFAVRLTLNHLHCMDVTLVGGAMTSLCKWTFDQSTCLLLSQRCFNLQLGVSL
jgi:hypothetical protein